MEKLAASTVWPVLSVRYRSTVPGCGAARVNTMRTRNGTAEIWMLR